ncbi:MAG: hypothetical protein HY075_13175 [Deltaproteobacteria bacterium]|nr:hypothetical protein [Deltaproteobacteria bacterium]
MTLDVGAGLKDIAAASTRHDYALSDDVRVTIGVRLVQEDGKPTAIEVSKFFTERKIVKPVKTVGKKKILLPDEVSWSMMMAFYSPTSIEFDFKSPVIFSLPTDASGLIPAFSLECTYKREKVDGDCATCR